MGVMRYQPQGLTRINRALPWAADIAFLLLPHNRVTLPQAFVSTTGRGATVATSNGLAYSHTGPATFQTYDTGDVGNLDNSDFTILVALDQIGNTRAWRGMIGKRNEGVTDSQWSLFMDSSGRLSFGAGNIIRTLGDVNLANRTNAMYAVTGSLATGQVIGYQDGVATGTAEMPGSVSGVGHSIRLGVIRTGASSENFLGNYRLAMVIRRALSPVEIKSLYQNLWQLFESSDGYDSRYASNPFTYFDTYGTSHGVASASAKLLAIRESYGKSEGASDGQSSAQALRLAAGTSVGTSSVNSQASAVAQINANAVGSSNATAILQAVTNACGTSTGTSHTGCASASVWFVAGSASGTSTAQAIASYNGTVFFDTEGASYGSSIVAAQARAVMDARGLSVGSSVAVSSAQVLANAIGTALGSATVNGTGAMVVSVTGEAVAASFALGTAYAIKSAAGATAGASQAVAKANALVDATGSAEGAAGAQCVTLVIYETVASSLSTSQVQAIIQTVSESFGNSAGHSTSRGVTEGGVHYLAAGDQYNITLMFSPYAIEYNGSEFRMALNSADEYTIKRN